MSDFKYSTFFLLKDKGSYLTGLGTVLNIGGNYFDYNYSLSVKEADWNAIHNDWGVIGQDISEVIQKLEKEQSKQLALKF